MSCFNRIDEDRGRTRKCKLRKERNDFIELLILIMDDGYLLGESSWFKQAQVQWTGGTGAEVTELSGVELTRTVFPRNNWRVQLEVWRKMRDRECCLGSVLVLE